MQRATFCTAREHSLTNIAQVLHSSSKPVCGQSVALDCAWQHHSVSAGRMIRPVRLECAMLLLYECTTALELVKIAAHALPCRGALAAVTDQASASDELEHVYASCSATATYSKAASSSTACNGSAIQCSSTTSQQAAFSL
eukprot:9337-Heterococcus_DN1.PRE.5